MFRAGSTIRELLTGKLYLVVQSFKCAVLVCDLNSGLILNEPKLIVERDYDEFADDLKIDRRKVRDTTEWNLVSI